MTTNKTFKSTKLRGDIAEQAVALEALKRGWGVSQPIGDRHPYDLIFDVDNKLIKIQVKYAWKDRFSGDFMCDNRQSKTNRRVSLTVKYKKGDFDFAILYAWAAETYWIMPFDVFNSFKGGMRLLTAETQKSRQRLAISSDYRNRWDLIGPTLDAFHEEEIVNFCTDCGVKIHAKSNRCLQCHNKRCQLGKISRNKIQWPATADLIEMVNNKPFTTVAKELGVTDNAIRKRIKNHPINQVPLV